MATQQILEGNWNEIKGKLRQKWGQLSDNDLAQARGNIDELIGLIQSKTGEGRAAIEAFLHEMSDHAGSLLGTAAERLQDVTKHAAESVQQTAKAAGDQVRAGYIETERIIRERPTQSLAVSFGVGFVAGVLVGLLLRSE
jgi:uncharacterized protein YjbJ (UPF0337 family)